MSVIVGVLTGLPIAMLQVAMQNLRNRVGPFALDEVAVAVPFVLVPLALFWGWTWACERWAGRAIPRLILYTLGLYAALGFAGPFDMLVFWPEIDVPLLVAKAPELVMRTLVFAVPALPAAVLFWAFGSGRLPMNRLTLAMGYLVGPFVAVVSPLVAVGTVAGTAAGHAWRVPTSRTTIAFLVVGLMLVIAFALPFGLAAIGLTTRPVRPLLP